MLDQEILGLFRTPPTHRLPRREGIPELSHCSVSLSSSSSLLRHLHSSDCWCSPSPLSELLKINLSFGCLPYLIPSPIPLLSLIISLACFFRNDLTRRVLYRPRWLVLSLHITRIVTYPFERLAYHIHRANDVYIFIYFLFFSACSLGSLPFSQDKWKKFHVLMGLLIHERFNL